MITAVGHDQAVVRVNYEAVWVSKLTGRFTIAAPRQYEVQIAVEFLYSVVQHVGHVYVSVGVHDNATRTVVAELPVRTAE